MHEFSVAVVGIAHTNEDDGSNRRFEISQLERGEAVELRPEPKNKHDRYAVGVFSRRGVRIGYIPAERAPWIGARIRAGEEVEAVYQEAGPTIAVVRVKVGGGAPTLPPVKPPRQVVADDGFYPDPDGPEFGA